MKLLGAVLKFHFFFHSCAANLLLFDAFKTLPHKQSEKKERKNMEISSDTESMLNVWIEFCSHCGNVNCMQQEQKQKKTTRKMLK